MNWLQYVKVFAIGYGAYMILEILWLGFLMRNFYIKNLASYLRTVNGTLAVDWPSALLVWGLLILGLLIFVLPKGINASLVTQFCWGALYGLIVYGVYDGTNFAMLSDWPLVVVVADLLWGMVINGVVACIMRLV